MSGMILEAGIMYTLNGRMRMQEVGQSAGVLGVRTHPPRQAGDAAQRQPAVESGRHSAAVSLRVADAFEQVVWKTRGERTAQQVGVTTHVLGGGVHNHI